MNKLKTEIKKDAQKLTMTITGSIDTVTAPDLEKELEANWDGITDLLLDFSAVDYISSAGLRVMLTSYKHMKDVNGNIVLRGVNDYVKEVFEMTGFDQFLIFEE